MWCDNCLLLLPLRAGSMAWAVIIFLYSVAGGVVMFEWGQYLYFTYPEWEIYGGIGFAVAFVAFINIIALSNRSYTWTGVCRVLWPFMIVISAVRAVVMIVELQRGKPEIEWECANGQQLWPASVAAGYGGTRTMPSTICTAGFPTVYAVFIISLLVDLGFQFYMFFMTWRYQKLLEHYEGMLPQPGGYYKA